MATRTQRRTASNSPATRSGTKKKKNKAAGPDAKKIAPKASEPAAFPTMLSAMTWEPAPAAKSATGKRSAKPAQGAQATAAVPATPNPAAPAQPTPQPEQPAPETAPPQLEQAPQNPAVAATPPIDEAPGTTATPPEHSPVLPKTATTPIESMPPPMPPTHEPVLSQPDSPPPHPVEDFLSGILEGLPAPVNIRLACTIGDQAKALPVRQLLFLGQAIQLLVTALDDDVTSPPLPDALPILSVHLDGRPDSRLVLRLYDDGRYFARLLPETTLRLERLRPLLLFVTKQGGSIRLAKGHCQEFTIIR